MSAIVTQPKALDILALVSTWLVAGALYFCALTCTIAFSGPVFDVRLWFFTPELSEIDSLLRHTWAAIGLAPFYTMPMHDSPGTSVVLGLNGTPELLHYVLVGAIVLLLPLGCAMPVHRRIVWTVFGTCEHCGLVHATHIRSRCRWCAHTLRDAGGRHIAGCQLPRQRPWPLALGRWLRLCVAFLACAQVTFLMTCAARGKGIPEAILFTYSSASVGLWERSMSACADAADSAWIWVPALWFALALADYRLLRVLAHAEPRCLYCGYVLRGLPSSQCPECGHVWSVTQEMRNRRKRCLDDP